jgi:hypothetical protein
MSLDLFKNHKNTIKPKILPQSPFCLARACTVKLFMAVVPYKSKLECLPLSDASTIFYYLLASLGAYSKSGDQGLKL